jgi:8-oxo-dGTP diphosphatase
LHMSQEAHIRFAVVATDIAAFALLDGKLCIRLISVSTNPDYLGMPALPGGLIQPTETAEQAATRLLTAKGELGLPSYLEQFHTFSALERDTRGRVIAIAFLALITPDQAFQPHSDTTSWCAVENLPRLAYDHQEIAERAVVALRQELRGSYDLLRHLTPVRNTLTQLEQSYSAIMGTPVDRRNFQKKLLASGILVPTTDKAQTGPMRPATVYQYRPQ